MMAIGVISGFILFLLLAALSSFQSKHTLSEAAVSVPLDSTGRSKGTINPMIERKLAEGKKPNRLIKEKSPYLLQHAFNPVEWYAWGEEAFTKAREEDKPIFLSIGYSTCYWCHVMEREVFENDSIAALMNKYVVSVKVDREERPDVDRVYMTALSAMTGSGGWPMSMFLTPDLKPFFGATYIPPAAKYGRAGFPDILTRIHQLWTAERREILEAGERAAEHLKQVSAPDNKPTNPGSHALEKGFDSFSGIYDHENAGFGSAPKFPRPVAYNFLFRYYSRTREKKGLEMSLETLKRMHKGGMYDHIGGGFHRYSTDATWHVPHFEKMLYDQAQLVMSYLEAYQITHDPYYADVARDVFLYVEREMTHRDGGFFSAQDAESGVNPSEPDVKKEGAFYTWTKREVDEILTSQESEVFGYHFDVQSGGNARYDPHSEFVGLNILRIARTKEETASNFRISPQKVDEILSSARKKLFQFRSKRSHPHLDDKILVSWNGLMISAYARAYQVLDNERYLHAARLASTFILKTLYNAKTKVLLRRYREDEARFEATLEDYAFLTQGLLDLYESSFEIRWLKSALELTERQNALFYDRADGGFYDVTEADKTILVRTKESYDGAEPTGNSIAILNLLRLSQMTDNDSYREIADKSLEYFGERMSTTPQALPQFLVALDFSLSKPKQIILVGKPDDIGTKAILHEVHARFIPNKIVMLAVGESQKELASFMPFLSSLTMIAGKPTAYICENFACELPTSEAAVVAQLLDGSKER